MADQYTVRVVRHSGINGSLCLAVTLSDPLDVVNTIRELLMNRGPVPTKPGDVITINLMGDEVAYRERDEELRRRMREGLVTVEEAREQLEGWDQR